MNHGTNCQFCHKPITLDIDDDYATVGDPHKLIPMAACDRCADLRTDRRRIEDQIKTACMNLKNSGRTTPEVRDRTRGLLDKLCHKYAQLIARWHYLQGETYDDECVNLLMDKPDHWAEIIGILWKLFRDSNPGRVKA